MLLPSVSAELLQLILIQPAESLQAKPVTFPAADAVLAKEKAASVNEAAIAMYRSIFILVVELFC